MVENMRQAFDAVHSLPPSDSTHTVGHEVRDKSSIWIHSLWVNNLVLERRATCRRHPDGYDLLLQNSPYVTVRINEYCMHVLVSSDTAVLLSSTRKQNISAWNNANFKKKKNLSIWGFKTSCLFMHFSGGLGRIFHCILNSFNWEHCSNFDPDVMNQQRATEDKQVSSPEPTRVWRCRPSDRKQHTNASFKTFHLTSKVFNFGRLAV